MAKNDGDDKKLDPDDDIEIDIEEEEEQEEQEERSEAEEEEQEEQSDSRQESEEDEDEAAKLGRRAQKRIKALLARAKSAEERLANSQKELVQQKEENEKLKESSTQNEDFSISQYEERIKAETERLEAAMESAVDSGDPKAIAKVSREIAAVEAHRLQLDTAKKQREARKKASAVSDDQEADERKQDRPQVDRRALKWVRQNSWYGPTKIINGEHVENPDFDEEKTMVAWSIHQELLSEGFMPDIEPDEYWKELDSRIAGEFPEESKGDKRRPGRTVAGGSRNSGKKKNSIKLTKDEVALCERNGIPLKEYAREKARLSAKDA